MKITVTKEYTKEDERLLKQQLPDNPCDTCGVRPGECCGCPAEIDYQKLVKPYKENNIYDIVLKLKRKRYLEEQISKCKSEISEIDAELPSFLVNTR